MSLAACAQLVERADPERFRAIMAAPVAARRVLFPVFAFNVEVARAPWVTQEAMIAEMRLQWWRDALEEIGAGGPARRHEVVDALAAVLDAEGARDLDRLVAARRWDIYKDSFENEAHLYDYLDATSAAPIWTAARLLGPVDETVVRDFGQAVGIANLLRAAATLDTLGRKPLLDGRPDGIRRLAREGVGKLDRAARARGQVSKAAGAALLTGWMARPLLTRAARTPSAVADGDLTIGPARQALRLAKVSVGGWWR